MLLSQNKIVKTLDNHLLGMSLGTYVSSLQRFNQLNVAKQCLLAKSVGSGLWSRIRNRSAGNGKRSNTLDDVVYHDKNEIFITEEDEKRIGSKELELRNRAMLRRQALYQNQLPTEELAETHYMNMGVPDFSPELITANTFWVDYAKWTGEGIGPFLSQSVVASGEVTRFRINLLIQNFIYATKKLCKVIFVLAIVDLPLGEPAKPEMSDPFTPRSHLKHIGACGSPMPITQGTVVITNQCASILTQPISTPSCTDVIILTHTSSSRQRVELFVQVPAGAIPIKGRYTVTQLVDLSPFSIWQTARCDHMKAGVYSLMMHAHITGEYLFYFPETGSYPHLSAYVSKSGELLARSSPTTIVVTNKYNPIDRTSWATIVSRGSTRDVLDQEPK
ncbi:hypothetical protein BC936DRAFT_145593 [Jimgerdemannia flammicorona]|uniref:Uncharacterized protein n=1 Tax=Jimgerdemannia flammicorona TaxID=994334 RepID=A0A433D9M2_9FUNG|nr:hypothetical protein BC936DRAFT_145593 [Jimgerdemannia flammicorona]